jgi:protein TonB
MPLSLLLMLLMGQATTPEAPATPVPDVEAVAGQAREGTVELECTVQPDGRVSDCIVLSERPRGMGFGEAALSAARRARLSPRSVDGVATGGKIRFRTRFQIAD